MGKLKIYFSDCFGVDEDIIETYGAVNISLINGKDTEVCENRSSN